MLDLEQAAKDLDHLDTGVYAMARAIVRREGGWSDNPNDSGGPTNYGVSLRHARAQGLAFDLDHNGVVDANDIRLVTPEIATIDFLEVFFMQPGINKLPACMQPCTFDHAVNGGPAAAIRISQAALNTLRGGLTIPALTIDGVLGPNTLIAAHQIAEAVGDARVIDALVDAREGQYRWIAANHPQDAIFLGGWLSRAEGFRPGKSASVPAVQHQTVQHQAVPASVSLPLPVTHASVPAPTPVPTKPALSEADVLNQRELDNIHTETP